MAKTQLRYVIGADISQAEKAFKSVANSIDRAGRKFTNFGKASSAALTVPLTAVMGMAVKVGLQVDDALDDIRIGTGATGDALRGLEADFKAIATAVPQDFGASAKAIADFNTMTGASGKRLQDLSVAALDASRMMKTDLGGVISSTGKLMNNWKVPVEQSVELMDKLFVASQSTGMSMDAIAASATKSGAALRQMGFSSDETIALIAKLDKEGIQADQMLRSLNKALATLAKEGVTNTSQAFGQIINSIKNAKTDSEATARAVEIFGSKAGPDLATAVREGRFEIDDLVKSLGSAGGAIKQTVKDTDGFTEQWGRFTNEMSMALEPLGTKLLSMAEKEMPHLSEAIKKFSINMDEGTIKTLAITAAIGPATLALGGLLSSVTTIVKTGGFLLGLMSGPVGLIAGFTLLTGAATKLQDWLDRVAGKAAKSREEIEDLARATEIATQRINQSLDSNPNNIFNINSYGQAYEHAVTPADMEQARKERSDRDARAKQLQEDMAKADLLDEGKRNSQTMKLPKKPKVVSPEDTYSPKGKSGPTAAEKFADNVGDRMKYLKEDGQSFLSKIEAMQSKLKPLTDDWKVLEDLKVGINQETFDKSLQGIQDQIRYLDKDGISFLPDLKKMQGQFEPLSEEWKRIQDLVKSVNDEIAQMETKKWQDLSWDFSQGFLKADEYAALLQDKLSDLTLDSDKWKETFAELQGVMSQLAGKDLDRLNEMLSSNKMTTKEWKAALEELVLKYGDFPNIVQNIRDLQDEQKKTKQDVIDLNALTIEWAKDLQSGFADAIVEGKNFGDVLDGIGKEMVKIAVKMALFGNNGTGGLLGGLFGNIFGGMGFADGGTFLNGKTTPFARGGVVSSPTLFPMANGMGLMGEAGPEAVMPLTRDSQGRLGVRAGGGGGAGNVSVHVENHTSTPIEADDVSIKYDDFERMVVGIVLRDQASNGPISQNFRR